MKKSVVLVYFPDRDMKLSYYNDQFDLKKGDFVYVDDKLEGFPVALTITWKAG